MNNIFYREIKISKKLIIILFSYFKSDTTKTIKFFRKGKNIFSFNIKVLTN